MDSNKKLLDLISEQKSITSKYEELIKEISEDTELNEINNLKNEVVSINKELEELEKKYINEVNDNLALKSSLMEQMINEKIAILNGSKRKIQIYFDDLEKNENNKLYNLELLAKKRINKAIKVSNEELKEESANITMKLNQIEKELKDSINKKKESLRGVKSNILDEIKKEYEDLKNETIDESLINKKKKENDIEVKIGLNLINKIGIILLLLGVATGMKYTYSNWFGPYMKSVLGFVFGLLLLGIGEWFNKKEKNVFALGLCGGGIGILYLSVFSSYFILNTLILTAALLVSLLITAISIVLAKRYSSQTITAMSLIGGYLPFFSYVFIEGLNTKDIYIAMSYLLVLNLTILILSTEKRWTFIKYLSFVLNISTSIYLMLSLNNDIISILYSLTIFIMYMSIILVKPINENLILKIPEIVLLALNTLINFSLMYFLFNSLGWDDFTGFLALVYGITYYLIGRLISKKAVDLTKTSDLFYLTSLTFAVLMIPFQFGIEWISMGWLVESVLLIHFFKTKYKDEKKMESAGWVIFSLCIAAFLNFDFHYIVTKTFIFKYTVITSSLIYILKLYLPDMNKETIFDKSTKGLLLNIYKYFVVIFSWIFLLRISYILYENFIDVKLDYGYFFIPIIFALITGIYSYVISNIEILKDKIINIISIVMYVLVSVTCLLLTSLDAMSYEDTNIRILSIIILIIYNIYVFFNIKSLTLKLIKYKKLTLEIFPLVMAIYLLGVIPVFLINQFYLSNINLIISIIFVILSFVYIVYGFKEKYTLIRRFGLFLSMFATAKLFILDLMFLSTLGRIIAYLSFGLTLIGISFIYQKLKLLTEADNQ